MWVGGIRTSTTATSGLWARTLRSRSSASAARPTTSRPASSSSRATPSRSRAESSATTTRIGMLPPRHASVPCAAAGLVDGQLAVERRHPVGEAAQPGAGGRVGAADAVVAHLDLDRAVAAGDADRRRLGLGVAGDVGQRLGDDEVGGRLDRRRQPLGRRLDDLDRDRGAAGEPAQRRREAAVAEHDGVDAAGQLAQLGGRRRELGHRLVEQLAGHLRVGVELAARQAQVHGERHQPLLGAVVEVALDPAPLGVAGVDDAGARGAQLLDLGAQLGLQPLVLQGERAARHPARVDQPPLVGQEARSQIIAPTGAALDGRRR